MHQTTRQISRETCIHHPSVYSIIHQDFQLKFKMSEEMACAGTHYMATVYISQTYRSCYKVE